MFLTKKMSVIGIVEKTRPPQSKPDYLYKEHLYKVKKSIIRQSSNFLSIEMSVFTKADPRSILKYAVTSRITSRKNLGSSKSGSIRSQAFQTARSNNVISNGALTTRNNNKPSVVA